MSTQFTAKIELSRALEKQMQASHTTFATAVIEALAEHFKFSAPEAIKLLGLEKVEVARKTTKTKTKTEKVTKTKRNAPSVQLPFCGICVPGWCEGIRLNHKLYTQCTMPKDGDTRFCKTCNKQCDSNSNGLPTYGDVQKRIERGNEWRDPKGAMPAHYGNVFKKLNIDRKVAEAEAEKFGMTIPAEAFEPLVRPKGRPKKSVAASDTESEASAPKKRGRPKKAKTVVAEMAPGDDLIKSLLKQAKQGEASDSEVKTELPKDSDGSGSEGEVKTKKPKKPKTARTASQEEAHKAEKKEKKKAKAAKKEAEAKAEAKTKAKTEAKAKAKAAKEEAKAAKEEAKAKVEAEAKAEAEAKEETKTKTTDESDYATNSDSTIDELNAAAGAVVCDLGAVDDVSDVEEGEVEDEDEENEGGTVEVEKFELNGTHYLKTEDDVLYDPETKEEVGIYNAETNKIEPISEDSD